MKKTISVLILFAFIGSILSEEIVSAQNLRTQAYQLAVLNLIAGGDLSQEEANLFTKRLYRELNNQEVFNCIPLDVIENTLMENGLDPVSCSDLDCGLRVGQLLNVPFVAMGTLSKTGSIFSIEVEILDVAQEKFVQRVTEEYQGGEVGLLDYLSTVATKLINFSISETESVGNEPTRQQVSEYPPVTNRNPQQRKSNEQAPSKKQTMRKGGSMKWLGVGVLVLGGVGAAYYFLVAKDKKTKDTNDITYPPLPGPPSFP